MKKAIIASLALAAGLAANAGNVAVQNGFALALEYETPVLAPNVAWNTTTRSGVGIDDKFYIVDYNTGVLVYDKEGTLLKTIAAPEGYFLWTCCNLDDAGHLLVQLDKHAFNGQNSANGDHGFMIIDTKTDEIIKDFLPMTCGAVYRYDCMAPVSGNILESEKVGIYSVLQGQTTSYRFLYNAVGAEKPTYWTTKAFATAMEIDPAYKVNDEPVASLYPEGAWQKQASTGYARQYTFAGNENFSIGVYANPHYEETYSAEGKFGNGIRSFAANYVAGKWFYTPQHSGLTGFNFFNLDGKDYIIYPAGGATNAPDAFAIAEVSYVDSPATDMTMEGEALVDGKLAGVLKARVFAALNDETGAPKYSYITSGAPSYYIEPVEGDAKSVYIYTIATGAPGAKYKFTVGVEDEPVTPPLGEATAPATIKATQAMATAPVEEGVYTVTVSQADGQTAPAWNAGSEAIRAYTANTITVKGGVIEEIKFVLARDAAQRYCPVTVNTGEITPAQAAADTEFTWKGKADEVVFTVGEKATLGTDTDKNGNPKAGQLRFVQIDINGGVAPAPEPTVGTVGGVATQQGYTLKPLYTVDNIAPKATQLNHRSGVGVNDKFYVNEHAAGIKVYDNLGNLIKTIPATEGYHNWISCNVDQAGHLLAQIDVKAFDGTCSADGGHGFMIIDTETDEVIKDFLPMTSSGQRYDAMSPVAGNILETEKVGIWSVLSGGTSSFRYLYNAVGAEKPTYWTTKSFNSSDGIVAGEGKPEVIFPAPANKQTTTGYAMQYVFNGDENFSVPVFANPEYTMTYSAEGLYGNAIRKYLANYTATDQWFYTPQHSGLTGFNFFNINGKDFIIYPAGKSNDAADAFAIAEVSYVDSPATDMAMEGETLVDGKPVGKLVARVFAAINEETGAPLFGAAAQCTPSYNIVPVEGDKDSVYIYFFNSGAPGSKWMFTYDPTQTAVEGIETVDQDAPAVYYNLQGVRVANPTRGLYIKAQGGKATKVIL